MKNYLLAVWDYLRGSYWLLPSLLGFAAFCLGFLVPHLDQYIASIGASLPETIRTTTSAARLVISAIASGMFTITGTVFSITVVALSLTSQQFGPRLLRTFMFDKITQLTLGIFIATGVYSLLILRILEDTDAKHSTPQISVALGICMAIVSIAVLIVFIHHLAMLIQAPHVVRAVANDLDSALDRLFPETLGEAYEEELNKEKSLLDRFSAGGHEGLAMLSSCRGYIQGLDEEHILDLASKHSLVIRLFVRPGDFVVCGAKLASVTSADMPSDSESDSESDSASEGGSLEVDFETLSRELNSCLLVGNRRTPRQDIACTIDELVEIAVRSLSPGVNDPFTAVNCIDWLGSSLSTLAKRRLPSGVRTCPDGNLRVIVPVMTYEELIATSFSAIRLHSRGDMVVQKHLFAALANIGNNAVAPELKKEINRHIELVYHAASQEIDSDFDKAVLDSYRERARESLT